MTMDTTIETAGENDVAEVWDELDDVTSEFAGVRPKKDRQLNLRVDEGLLAALREAAARTGEGYHTFARRLIEEGVAHALAEPSVAAAEEASTRPFRMKEVMLVLLGAGGSRVKENEEILSRTRLQKLLFLAAQHLQPEVASRFEAYDFGPFGESVETDVDFLASEGLVEATGREAIPEVRAQDPERGRRMLEWVRTQHAAVESRSEQVESYRLTRAGMEWVRRFLASDQFGQPDAKQRLVAECEELKRRFGRVPLEEVVDFVYSEYPEFTARSKIRHQVAERLARKTERE
jgi:predicted DNA binding CopG/RHH family protein